VWDDPKDADTVSHDVVLVDGGLTTHNEHITILEVVSPPYPRSLLDTLLGVTAVETRPDPSLGITCVTLPFTIRASISSMLSAVTVMVGVRKDDIYSGTTTSPNRMLSSRTNHTTTAEVTPLTQHHGPNECVLILDETDDELLICSDGLVQ